MILEEDKNPFEDLELTDEARFLSLALSEFPDLREDFEEYEGLLHPQMAAFSRVAEEAIERGDFVTLNRCYKIVDDTMKNASPNVENAVYVSFLEHLYFEGSPYGAEARRLLPPKLSGMLVELEEHFQMLRESQQARELEENNANN